MRAILFDCDGTLADTCGLICETMRRVFARHRLDAPDEAATRGVIGLSLDEAILRLHPECKLPALARMVEDYRVSFRQTRMEAGFAEALFPGVRLLLEDLRRSDGLALGLVTGKSRRGVSAIIEAHGLAGYFKVARTADDCPSKPHPGMVLECCDELGVAPLHTLVVGDSIFDMQMARAAGADALGVAWGAASPAELAGAGAFHVAESVAELRQLLGRWLDAPLSGDAAIAEPTAARALDAACSG